MNKELEKITDTIEDIYACSDTLTLRDIQRMIDTQVELAYHIGKVEGIKSLIK